MKEIIKEKLFFSHASVKMGGNGHSCRFQSRSEFQNCWKCQNHDGDLSGVKTWLQLMCCALAVGI